MPHLPYNSIVAVVCVSIMPTVWRSIMIPRTQTQDTRLQRTPRHTRDTAHSQRNTLVYAQHGGQSIARLRLVIRVLDTCRMLRETLREDGKTTHLKFLELLCSSSVAVRATKTTAAPCSLPGSMACEVGCYALYCCCAQHARSGYCRSVQPAGNCYANCK